MEGATLNSASFNKTSLMGSEDREFMGRLLKEKFFSINEGEYWRHEEANQCIKIALNLGLTDVADELTLYTI